MNVDSLQTSLGVGGDDESVGVDDRTDQGTDDHTRIDRPNHIALMSKDRDSRLDVLVSCISEGLDRNERCTYIGSREDRRALCDGLCAADIDVDDALERGALMTYGFDETYLDTGTFDLDRMLSWIAELIADTDADPRYTGFRSAGDMAWMLDEAVRTQAVMAYESKLNTLDSLDRCLVFCQYDRERFSRDILSDVIRTHPFVVYDGTLCRNFYYYPPADFEAADRTPLDIERIGRGLVSQARKRVKPPEGRHEREAQAAPYRTLVDHFPNGAVALFDEELRYTAAGGPLLDDLLDDRGSPVGDSVLDHCPPSLAPDVESNVRAALAGEERTCELDLMGHRLLAQTVPIGSPDEGASGGMIVVVDVSERVEYERQLEEARDRVAQFASSLSHDLKEPLRSISGYLELLERRYEGELDPEADEFIDYAVGGATRMRGIIDGLATEYARFDTEAEPMEPVALDAVLEETLIDLHRKIEDTDADISVHSLPTVRGNPCQLNQLFFNLLDNAIKYAGEAPPEVHISAERDGEMWTIAVRDSGIGMDPTAAETVFDMFHRLHDDETAPGAGLGLALCQRIVDQHGGTIWVESVPGDGSTFSFTLPAVDADADAA